MPRWSNQSVVILASGPSLTRADADYARLAAGRVIVINNTWELCPRADVLYAADARWWEASAPGAAEFAGERWSASRNDWKAYSPIPGLNLAKTKQGEAPPEGDLIYEGANSGFQALGLAVMWGARRIVLLGYDMQNSAHGESHHHGSHTGNLANPTPAAFAVWRKAFNAVAPKYEAMGVEVINASRKSALSCFPHKLVTDAIP